MPSSRLRVPAILFALGFLSTGLGACSSSPGGGAGTGGTTGSGGTVSSGGSGSGGATGTGGVTGSGGSVGSGGKGSGGAPGSGGTVATGGSNAGGTTGTGGSSAKGGSGAGGAATGGSAKGGAGAGGAATGGSAGSPGTGGAATGGSAAGGTAGGPGGKDGSVDGPGTGGAATGGSSGTGTGGAATGGSTGATTSPGCGSASPLKTSTSLSENIDGTTRKWMLDVPTNYDTNKPYKMIFVWHPLGGNGSQIVSGGYNGLKSLSNGSAVFATADGLNGSNGEASGTGWWNANGGDMKLFKAMLDKINAGLCIDQTRIFSTGFSFGGMMSYTLPFEFDVFRAVAPCSGKTGVIPYNDKFSGPVAIMAFHGDSDTFVATNLGKAFFDKFAARNKCGTQTTAVSPTGCNQYQGCVVPSTWCLFPGGHNTWSEEPGAIWKFFASF